MRVVKKSEMYNSGYSYLHPNEYVQELNWYPFLVILDKCCRSYNTLNDLSNYVFQIKQKI